MVYDISRRLRLSSFDLLLNANTRKLNLNNYIQGLFPIVQRSTYKDLRRKSAEYNASVEAGGNAIGIPSVGEPYDEMYAMAEVFMDILPIDKPRYLMGVGTPIKLLENIALGVDILDCVMAKRNERNGVLFTAQHQKPKMERRF